MEEKQVLSTLSKTNHFQDKFQFANCKKKKNDDGECVCQLNKAQERVGLESKTSSGDHN